MNPLCARTFLRTHVPVVLLGVVAITASCSLRSALAQGASSLRTGVVRSPVGRPITQVWVQQLGAWSGSFTKADGRFMFAAGTSTLLFVRDGFQPEIRLVTGADDDRELSVVLEPEQAAALTLRSCGLLGAALREIEPAKVRGLKLKHGGDVDFTAYAADYSYGRSVWHLTSMTGIHAGGLTPTPDWVAGISSFTVRSLKCGGEQWFDLRGASVEGRESRWVSEGLSHVEYSNVPTPVARVFDKAIDNGCCR